jgi:hypothetical protein
MGIPTATLTHNMLVLLCWSSLLKGMMLQHPSALLL